LVRSLAGFVLARLIRVLARLIWTLTRLIWSLAGLIRIRVRLIRILIGRIWIWSLAWLVWFLARLILIRVGLLLRLRLLPLLILGAGRNCGHKGASPSQRAGKCQRTHGGNLDDIALYRLHEWYLPGD
jgi:hypothetical protein